MSDKGFSIKRYIKLVKVASELREALRGALADYDYDVPKITLARWDDVLRENGIDV
jgi:hypothetical protein